MKEDLKEMYEKWPDKKSDIDWIWYHTYHAVDGFGSPSIALTFFEMCKIYKDYSDFEECWQKAMELVQPTFDEMNARMRRN